MAFYWRRLPCDFAPEQAVFLTWRLRDSLTSHRSRPADAPGSGPAFADMDGLPDDVRSGRFHPRQRAVADMIVEAIQYNANILGHYLLHAFVVMPNCVHLLATPVVALPRLTESLKSATAKRASAMLPLARIPFWQEDSYDHWVRDEREFEKIRNYIEGNPVRAGLVREASEYRWSSAGWGTGPPADQIGVSVRQPATGPGSGGSHPHPA